MATISIDFDGVIHKYSRGWADGTIYDEPMPGAIVGLHRLMHDYAVVVQTSRNKYEVSSWLQQHGVPATIDDNYVPEPWYGMGRILVTNMKIPAVAYVDDRAIRFSHWEKVTKDLVKHSG